MAQPRGDGGAYILHIPPSTVRCNERTGSVNKKLKQRATVRSCVRVANKAADKVVPVRGSSAFGTHTLPLAPSQPLLFCCCCCVYYISISLGFGIRMCRIVVPPSVGLKGPSPPYGLGMPTSSGMYAFGLGSAVVRIWYYIVVDRSVCAAGLAQRVAVQG